MAVVPSGSGATHAGLLTGLRLVGQAAPVYGICVRRGQEQQKSRLKMVLKNLSNLMGIGPTLTMNDVLTWDGALASGYGKIGDTTREALTLMARTEGIFWTLSMRPKPLRAFVGC